MTRTVVCDLDGVVYRGDAAIPGALEGLTALTRAGFRVLFATNNSAREPSAVVEKLERVVGLAVPAEDVITSSVVAATLLDSGPVLVVGESGVVAAVLGAGFEVTDDPAKASSVIVGLDRQLSYAKIAGAADAVRRGAALIATNRDPTYPTERGLDPGAGACVAAVETAAGVTGVTAGKPSQAMRIAIEAMVPDGPIWMIGDRPDTDIALASGPRWRSILVLTGVSPSAEGASAVPDHVAADLAEAVDLILAS